CTLGVELAFSLASAAAVSHRKNSRLCPSPTCVGSGPRLGCNAGTQTPYDPHESAEPNTRSPSCQRQPVVRGLVRALRRSALWPDRTATFSACLRARL